MTEPNNTLATATFIGALGFTPTSVFDFVGAADTQDYWRFTLSGTSDINIGLTGLTADADVQLLNSAGAVIGSSTRVGTNSEDIHFNARPAGTYYARVFRFSGDTNYNLRLSTADPSNIRLFGLRYAMDRGYKRCNPYIERHLAIFPNCFCSRAN